MHLGVVTTSYPRRAGDPAGNFVEGHVRALRALGHRVDVIAAGDPDDAAHRIPSSLFYRGGAPDRLERAPLRSAVAAAWFTARLAAAIARRASQWDAIIAHWLAPCALAALPSSTPLHAIAHGGDVHTLRRLGLLGPTLRALARRGARLVFVSDELRALARAAAPGADLDQALVQPMGLELSRFAALDRAPVDPPSILIAARLQPIKGVDVALAARAHLATSARLVIAGDGPERRALESRAPLGTTFLGEVDTAHRDRLLREASLVVVPSRATAAGRGEGMPTIALEALAAGVPVVASALGGLRELGPAIRLVPPGDPRALAGAIDQTLSDAPPAHALRAAVAHLDWSRVADRLLRSE
jgi:glycosyltransferase involved in cell wall biosynthesis